jgi:large subunit ribosomal protein L22
MAPRKVRLIVDAVRGLNVTEAETRLTFMQREAARPVLKLLQSAIANAEHNFKLDRQNLYVKTIVADAGATLKRSRPRAMGRAAPIRKRTTHISIILSDEARTPKVGRRSKRAVKPSTGETRSTTTA